MKRILQSFAMLLAVLTMPTASNAAYVQVADGVYRDNRTLFITSDVTSLGSLQFNPTEIYCYAMVPPALSSNTFLGYGATLHVPAAGMVSYFTTLYWCNFNNILSDAVEPQSVTMSESEVSVDMGEQLSLSATVAPSDAKPRTIYWSTTNTSVATVDNNGMVTAEGTGDCYIYATCVDKQAMCHVTVIPERVTITLDYHQAFLLPNHTLTLYASCSPTDVDLAVTSSNTAVALPRLVNGTIMVVGIAEGTATITVNASDGWGNPDQCEVTVYTELGDVNCDGYVNIADVTSLIDHILGVHSAVTNEYNADIDRNGKIGIADVTTIIDYILNDGVWPWEVPGGWVDLGLPSGTLWATCNVGASSPYDCGDHFAWGEIFLKEVYTWETYKWCEGSYTTLTKYCTNSSYGIIDNRIELLSEDDAVNVSWGPSWRMPTTEQLQELIDYCTCTWTTKNGMNGYLVIGPNKNTIFLPAAGQRVFGELRYVGSDGFYWSRMLDSDRSYRAYALYLDSGSMYLNCSHRDYGRSIRAVRVSQE